MSYEDAYAFMSEYVNDVVCTDWNIYCTHGSSSGPKGNCVTFVQYFIARYTTVGSITGFGNGRDVVRNLINKNIGFEDGGTIPRAYAIFSVASGSTMCGDAPCGHTGIVLGIDEERGKIYIGQEGYDTPLSWGLTSIEQDLDKYTNGAYTYAYTDSILKL